jgi:hypothetical protein
MSRALDLGYKDSKKGFTNNKGDLTSPANKSTGLTDCTKPTDI